MRIARMIQAVDAHACGEPGRVIVGGFLDVPGKTVFEKMQYIEKNADVLLVTFRNVPAFAVHIDLEIDVPHLGKVTVDVAYALRYGHLCQNGSPPHQGRTEVE